MKRMGTKDETKDGVVYKTVNRYSTGRNIYLMPDVPHLIKTTRNCWYASRTGGTRCMWVSMASMQLAMRCETNFVSHDMYRSMGSISCGNIYATYTSILKQKVGYMLAIG